MIKEISRKNIVLFSGPHASFTDIKSIKIPYVDFIFQKGGEYTVPELIKSIILGKDVSSVRGITYKTAGGHIMHTPPNRPLSHIPRLDYLRKYGFFPQNFGTKVSCLRTCLNRGCPHNCAFCGDIWNDTIPSRISYSVGDKRYRIC